MTIDDFATAQLALIRTMNFGDYLPTSWKLRGDDWEVGVFSDDEDSEDRIMNWARMPEDKADEILVAYRVDESRLKVIRMHDESIEARIVEV